MKNQLVTRTLVLTFTLVLQPSSFVLSQGSLTPPGAPGPTMKTLDQIGISAVTGSVIRGCAVYSNNAGGIFISGGTVTDCTCASNQEFGISASSRCVIRNNLCTSNTNSAADAAGILCSGVDSRIEGNTCTANSRGIRVTSTGCVIAVNVCSGSSNLNWDIAIGNAVAPIVNATTNAAAIAGNTYTGNLGSTDAHANFTY